MPHISHVLCARCGRFTDLGGQFLRLAESFGERVTPFPHLAKSRDMGHPRLWQGKILKATPTTYKIVLVTHYTRRTISRRSC
jgi:hypothetical protein